MGRRLQRRLPARMNICLSPSLRPQRPKFVGYILNAFLRNLPKFKADIKGDIGSTTLAVALYRASLITDAIIRAVTVGDDDIKSKFLPTATKGACVQPWVSCPSLYSLCSFVFLLYPHQCGCSLHLAIQALPHLASLVSQDHVQVNEFAPTHTHTHRVRVSKRRVCIPTSA